MGGAAVRAYVFFWVRLIAAISPQLELGGRREGSEVGLIWVLAGTEIFRIFADWGCPVLTA
jgi:hypothetical protein